MVQLLFGRMRNWDELQAKRVGRMVAFLSKVVIGPRMLYCFFSDRVCHQDPENPYVTFNAASDDAQ